MAREAENEEYEVDHIVKQDVEKDGRVMCLVRWVGYTASDDTWEPRLELLGNAKKKVEEFQRRLVEKARTQHRGRCTPKRAARTQELLRSTKK